MEDEWRWITVEGKGYSLISFVIKKDMISEEDLIRLDALLAYYKQNYRLHTSNPYPDSGIDYRCINMQEARNYIIEANIKRL